MKMGYKIIIIIFFIIILVYLIGFYFFYKPDKLKAYIPEKSFFYLHIDLNQSRRGGCLSNQWIENQIKDKFFEKISEENPKIFLLEKLVQKQNREILDEIGLVGLDLNTENKPKEDDFSKDSFKANNFFQDYIFFLKTKKWVDKSILIKNLNNFYIQQIDKQVWLVSTFPYQYEKQSRKQNQNNQDKFFEFSDLIYPAWAKGYIKPEFLNDKLEFNIYSDLYSKDISFLVEINDLKNIDNLLEQTIIKSFKIESLNKAEEEKKREKYTDDNKQDKGFILVYLWPSGIKSFKNMISQSIAFQNPEKKQVVMPDNTSFDEIVVNPDNFAFKMGQINNRATYYLNKEGLNKIFIWQDQEYVFLTNQRSLVNGLEDSFSFFLQEQKPFQSLFINIEDMGVKYIYFSSFLKQIKGIISFN